MPANLVELAFGVPDATLGCTGLISLAAGIGLIGFYVFRTSVDLIRFVTISFSEAGVHREGKIVKFNI